MGQDSKIAWTDHTINFWWGCTKVSPGCQHCYAEGMARRLGQNVFGHAVPWGKGGQRGERLHKARAESEAIQRMAQRKGVSARVFVNSMSDWLDDEVPAEWLAYLLETIHLCPDIDFQLLTKRPQNWAARMLAVWPFIPPGTPFMRWFNGWCCPVIAPAAKNRDDAPPANVWIGTTVEDQQHADERIPQLLQIPARVRFLSCEPLLGPVTLDTSLRLKEESCTQWAIHWIIAGGESGQHARPMHPDWVRSLRNQCQTAGVPFFFKQWGSWCPMSLHRELQTPSLYIFPKDGLRMKRLGPSLTGALLDEREWREFPPPSARPTVPTEPATP